MKSHRFVGACFAVMLVLLVVACSANDKATTSQNPPVTEAIAGQTARTLDCRKPNEHRFVVVESPNRKKDSDPVIPKDLTIVVGDEVLAKIELPKESEAKNFSLNSVAQTEVGFAMKIDWGGGLSHYEIEFNFRCKENNFYLYEVKKTSFSTTNPDSGNFLDKEKSKVSKIEPNLPLEKFSITVFMLEL